jgi:hypothetical protein
LALKVTLIDTAIIRENAKSLGIIIRGHWRSCFVGQSGKEKTREKPEERRKKENLL